MRRVGIRGRKIPGNQSLDPTPRIDISAFDSTGMNDQNKQILRDFLSHADEMKNDIMKEFEDYFGEMPDILPPLAERSEAFVLSTLSNSFYSRPKSLSPKTAELLALAAAAGAGAEHCTRVHIRSARKEGATRDEILDTLLIAGHIGRTKILSIAIREFKNEFD